MGIDGRGRLVVVDAYPWEESIKDLPGSRYLAAQTAWSLPATPGTAIALLTILAGSGAAVSPRVLAMAREADGREARRAVAADESATLPDLPWHEWLKTSPWPHQRRGAIFLRDSSAALIAATMGPQPVDTPVLTPKGWRGLGDLAVGDEVYGGDGRPVRIRDVRHYGQAPVFRVTLSDGTSTRCTAEHRWRVSTPDDRHHGRGERVLTTAQIVAQGTHQVSGSRRNRRFALPEQPILSPDATDVALPVAPYALGALLGDGSLGGDRGTPVLTCPDSDIRRRVADEVRVLGVEGVEIDGGDAGRCPAVRLSRSGGRRAPRGGNPLRAVLREMNLAVGGHDKFIPATYLAASVRQRTELLQGLLDTDGSSAAEGRSGGSIEFSTVSAQLAVDVAFLARSLGCRVRTGARVTHCQTGQFSSYRLVLRVPALLDPFWCDRRVVKFRSSVSAVLRGVESVEADGIAPVCCIELDVDDVECAIYLTGADLIPTLNSGKTATIICALNMCDVSRALIVAPAATLGVFPREFRLHSAREWHVENGRRRTRTGSIKKLSLADRWRAALEALNCPCGKPHAVVTNYEAMAAEPLTSAPLAGLVECVIYDEAHRLKAAGGASSWTAKAWVDQIPRRWAATGTPMPQTPDDVYGLFRALDPAQFGTNKTEFRARYIVMGQTRDGRAFPKDVIAGQRMEFSRRFHSITFLPKVDLKLPSVTHTVRAFDLEPAARRVYDQIRDEGVAEITAAVISAGGNSTPAGDERTVAPANAGVELLRLSQITGGATTDDDGEVATISRAKVGELGVVSRGQLSGGVLFDVGCVPGGRDGKSRPEPVVVYCRFRHDLASVAELTQSAGLRYREISGSRKDGLDDDAKMHPECDVLGVQMASGGVGIDLTRSRIAIWFSVGMELWLTLQAQARQHRPGQTRQVQNYYLIAEDSVDGAIYTALARKENIINAVTNAYLRREAERSSSELPSMDTPEGTLKGDAVILPPWLGPEAPTGPPVHDDDEAHALALAGFSGL